MDAYRVLQIAPSAEQEVVQAAFRALAHKYHPDHDATGYATRRMQELNEAYALIRDAAARSRYDATRVGDTPLRAAPAEAASRSPGVAPPRAYSTGTRLDFGRYAGWTLRDLARQDPDYLRWLSRHVSGIRYRTEIYQILGRMGVSAA